MTVQDFKPAFLPASTPSLADEVPPAPAGSVFVLAANGGFTSPPRKFNIHFGRDREEAHVPVGVNDPHVSRQHGKLSCQDREWWLRNDDRLPIRLPGEAMLLTPATPRRSSAPPLNHNLIQALLETATLVPEDLQLLGEDTA